MDINTIDYSDLRIKLLNEFSGLIIVDHSVILGFLMNNVTGGHYEEAIKIIKVLTDLNIITFDQLYFTEHLRIS